MGNQPSSGDGTSSSTPKQLRRFIGSTGLLGLSKAELDERCKPSGLYPSCQWEDKAIRKLVGDGKLAARLRGTENRSSPTDRECPICFHQYREVNTTKCCTAYICTECYLQVRPQKAKSPNCPFCNHSKFSVTVAQAMNAEAMLAREETEQRFIEAKIRERAEAAAASESSSDQQNSSAGAAAAGASPAPDGFGSSLQQDERVATLRARSSSISDQDSGEAIPEDVLRESFAMTPEERRSLEDEMRAQHSHPLSLRLEAEAEERRIQNEREFLRQNPHAAMEAQRARASSRRNRSGQGERRNWNQIVEAFERGGHGEVNSLDDLVVLEAAMILSMEEESRRRNNGNANAAGAGGGSEGFDANQHAGDGFPLVRSILSGRQPGEESNSTEQIQSLANSLNSRRRGRNSLLRAAYGAGGGAAAGNTSDNNMATALDTAGLLMRGISEDDQLAMAIAASLQDQQQPQQEGDQAAGGTSNDGAEGATVTASEQSDGVESAQSAVPAATGGESNVIAPVEGRTDASGGSDQVHQSSTDHPSNPPPGDLDADHHGEDAA